MNQNKTINILFVNTLAPQLFTYTNIGPVSGMSGVISPTNLSLFSSPVATPRSTPNARTTPVPRWNTGSFIALDDNMDYSMMSPLIAGTNQDQQGPPLMDDGKTSEPDDRALANFHSFFSLPPDSKNPRGLKFGHNTTSLSRLLF